MNDHPPYESEFPEVTVIMRDYQGRSGGGGGCSVLGTGSAHKLTAKPIVYTNNLACDSKQ